MFEGYIHLSMPDGSMNPEAQAIITSVELASGPFQTHSRLTQIAMTEKPIDFIADMVLPRVDAPFKFEYSKGETDDQFSIPETRATRAGRLTETEFGQNLVTESVRDYGLLAYVPDRDIREARQQNAAWDPVTEAATGISRLMELSREKRVAGIVFNADNYADGHSDVLAGADQWSNAASSPIDKILTALDQCITRPNVMVLGQNVWTKLRQHGDILAAVIRSGAGSGADGEKGAASLAAVADLLELDRILVGRTWNQVANRGQAAAYARLWGKHAALLHIGRPSGTRDQMPTWGFTAQAMERNVMTSQESSRGVGSGSRVLKISECLKEVISWDTAGYFFQNAVA